MDKIIEIVKSIISPEKSWSAFVMKIIGLIVVAVIAYVGFQQYSSLTVEEDTEIPIEEGSSKEENVEMYAEAHAETQPANKPANKPAEKPAKPWTPQKEEH